MNPKPQFIDLFAGCGGFSAGMAAAGFHSPVKVEIDAWACETLRSNFPDSYVFEGDIKKIPDSAIARLKGVDVIVGGPPCQGFSVAGPSQFGFNDPRNELVHHFLKWVKIIQPKIAVLENVPAILSKKNSLGLTIPDVIAEDLAALGYVVTVWTLMAADFGVPQMRKRAFIVMSKAPYMVERPTPTHATQVAEDLFASQSQTRPFVSAWEALSDLPKLNAGEGTNDPVDYPCAPKTDYQSLMRKGSSRVINHVAMRHTTRLIERFRQIKPGQSLKDAPAENGQLAKYTGELNESPFKYNNYRIVAETPCLTIPASFQSLFLHPFSDRNLTAREAARLMGFPDRFEFRGKRTTMGWERNLSQYNQIGNSVCPPVAQAIGYALKKAICKHSKCDEYLPDAPSFVSAVAGLSGEEPQSDAPWSKLACSAALRGLLASADKKLIARLPVEKLYLENELIKWKGASMPAGVMSLSLLLIADDACAVCRRDLPPYGKHSGSMQLLISKEDLQSLVRKDRDHGLDYHLRSVFEGEAHLAHVVADVLAELGVCEIVLS
ncbi:MAG: DNA cytosine methyltransferase, partial [Verrucomicrobiota bacterium]